MVEEIEDAYNKSYRKKLIYNSWMKLITFFVKTVYIIIVRLVLALWKVKYLTQSELEADKKLSNT